ncbi:MAG: hypothetical protein IT381_16650 [Deltaproteobacteria bacterium]|nr:hypothetical protein [Deltaproteobacteria bacterium]
MPLVLLTALALGAPAPTPLGSVYGKVSVKPSFFLGNKANGFQRRLGLPPLAQREPAGVVVALEGAALDKEKFDPATDEYPVRIGDGGFNVALIGGMVGTKVTLENATDRPLTFAGAAFLKEAIEAKGKKTVSLDTPGVFTLSEPSLPGSKLTLVVTANPYVIALDETGEFLFESLEAGAYTLKIYARDRAVSAPLEIKADTRTDFVLPLARDSGRDSGKADKKPSKPAPAPGKP